MQNCMDIGKINVIKLYSSAREASPSRFTGGGARGRVPIEGARKLTVYASSEDGAR